jgi:hypothetical protein
MHCASTMWRFSLLTLLFSFQLAAQEPSGNVFLDNYSTVEELPPALFYRLQNFIPDSTEFLRTNAIKPNVSFAVDVKSQDVNANSNSDVSKYAEHFYWDDQKRLTDQLLLSANGKDTLQHLEILWLVGKKPAAAVVTATDSMRRDTVRLAYNRAGTVASAYYTTSTIAGVHRDTSNRMYDSRGRLLIATGMYYGPLKGNFIYGYDNENRIVRRMFTTSSGTPLCVDTVIYQYNSDARSVMTVSHNIKVGADGKWIKIDQQQIYVVSGRVISHMQYYMPDVPLGAEQSPLYTVRYEYDSEGRLSMEALDQPGKFESVRTKYYYSNSRMLPDSLVLEEYVSGSRPDLYRVYRRDVRTYDNQNRLASVTILQYTYYEKKRKRTKVKSHWLKEERYNYG